jgi:uncharacterized membrane protein
MRMARAALAFVGLLPWIRGLADSTMSVSVKHAIDLAFAALCHHAPVRTLVLGGAAMCVCSRCAGVYAGVFLGAALPWGISPARSRIALGFGAALMMTDILSQDLGLHAPWHAVRLATGAIVGAAATAWMLEEMGRAGRSARDRRRENGQVVASGALGLAERDLR